MNNKEKTKKSILIVHNYYQIPGGEDSVVLNEKDMLENNGHKVIVYFRNNSEIRKMSKIKKVLLPLITIFNVKTYIDIRKIIIREGIDIVHIHNTLNLISPAVYYAALSLKKPVIQTIHNFRLICPGATFYRDGFICEDCVKSGLKCSIKYGCYRKSRLQTFICVLNLKIHKLTGIYKKINYICLTEFNKDKLMFRKHEIKKVFIKPNFISEKNSICRSKNRIDRFIFVGRLDKSKGVDILLTAWKRMGDNAPELLICGMGDMKKWCDEYIRKNNLKSVKLLGFVDNNKAINLIASSKALILPTQWYEGFPMTIVEAYSVGTPVIGSDIGNVGCIVKNQITGFTFKYNSIDDLIKSVYNIYKYTDIHETTYNEYKEKYTEYINYDMLMSIYNSISDKR